MAENSFNYTDFLVEADGQTVSFRYRIVQADVTYNLTETLQFPVSLYDDPSIHAGLRALHLALGVSYYKIFASPQLTQPYAIDDYEAAFWNDIWRNGLGEYCYVNQLSPDALAKFTAQTGKVFEAPADSSIASGILLGIGGGKDSVVAGELLKACDEVVDGFVMATGEQLGQALGVAETMGVALHVVERRLDTQLLELQEQPDAYKGHVPISLIFGLVGTVLAAATGKAAVVVANEASASIPRIAWEHGAVNHQWSKSFDFEQQLQQYVHQLITPAVTYFSAIRPLTSVAVAKIFAQFPEYFEVFTSDNYVFRIDPAQRPNARWSLESPKSLSSFILLAPWLSDADMERTFGRNFLNEPSLEPLFKQLVGLEGEPPLDCVGTVDELILSLNLAYHADKYTNAPLMKLALDQGVITETDWASKLAAMLALQPEQALPNNQTSLLAEMEQRLL